MREGLDVLVELAVMVLLLRSEDEEIVIHNIIIDVRFVILEILVY